MRATVRVAGVVALVGAIVFCMALPGLVAHGKTEVLPPAGSRVSTMPRVVYAPMRRASEDVLSPNQRRRPPAARAKRSPRLRVVVVPPQTAVEPHGADSASARP